MKQKFNLKVLFLMMIPLIVGSSCQKEKESNVLEFGITSDKYEVSDLGGEVLLPITSNVEWEVNVATEDWIRVSKVSNDLLSLKLTPNAQDVSREIDVTIKESIPGKNPLSATIRISQNKMSNPRISISNGTKDISFLSINAFAGNYELIINSNTKWKVSATEKWLKSDLSSGDAGSTKLTVTVEENSGDPRNAKFNFTVEGGTPVEFRIAQNGSNVGFNSATHYFYVTFGTMPTLYAGLHALSHDKPSFFAFERKDTFDPEMFPPHITLSIANGLPNEVQEIMRDYMKKKIVDIRDREPNAIFGLYVDDLRCRIAYDWFIQQGIDPSRVKVSLLSDGTGSYNNFYNFFGSAETGESEWNKYADEVKNLNWGTRSMPEFESWYWPYYMATMPHFRYVVQDASLFETNSDYVKQQLPKINFVSITPYQLLGNLSPERQETFYKMASFDKTKFSNLFDKSSKKNLVIIGTSGSAKQKDYVGEIYKKYGGEYDLFFKPHPSDESSKSYETDFPGLTLLPGKMPFEIFVWSLIDKIDRIGGYSSTVYLTVPIEKIKFIFDVSGPQNMPKPLNLLFQNSSDIEWMNL